MDVKKVLGFEEVSTVNFWKAVVAESLASALFIFICCGSALSLYATHQPTFLHIAIAHGFAVALIASAFSEISGGHFNPAVSVAMTIRRKISCTRCVMYIGAQCVGSLIGAVLLKEITPKDLRGGLGSLSLHPNVSSGFGCLVEMILTFVLVWTVIASTDPIKGFNGFQAPFAIGMSVMTSLLMGIPFTGASLNPIRALGPAVVMQQTANHWIYWVGPLLGCVIAALAYDYLFKLAPAEEAPEVKKEHTDSVKYVVSNSDTTKDESAISIE